MSERKRCGLSYLYGLIDHASGMSANENAAEVLLVFDNVFATLSSAPCFKVMGELFNIPHSSHKVLLKLSTAHK
jgi:hypothetical protein